MSIWSARTTHVLTVVVVRQSCTYVRAQRTVYTQKGNFIVDKFKFFKDLRNIWDSIFYFCLSYLSCLLSPMWKSVTFSCHSPFSPILPCKGHPDVYHVGTAVVCMHVHHVCAHVHTSGNSCTRWYVHLS